MTLSVEELCEYLRYDPETGTLWWIKRAGRSGPNIPGSKAHAKHSLGYICVRIKGHSYLAHRVAWALHHKTWPNSFVDHINGNRSDNRICNLRLADKGQNNANSRSRRLSLPKGVSRSGNRFYGQITFKGKRHYLGLFRTPEEAHNAYQEAAKRFHGEYARFQ